MFDQFTSFNKAAGFVEDWIRNKKNNATEFTNDLPAILERGKAVRKVLIRLRMQRKELEKASETELKKQSFEVELDQNGAPLNPEVKNVSSLIYCRKLYDTEDDYVFHYTLNFLEELS